MSRIRLMVNCPNPKDATSFYRGIGPLTALARKMPGLELVSPSEWNWATLALADAVFVQRPYSGDHVTIIKMAKSHGIPVWVDYDDDLFSVPISNPAYDVYGSNQVKANIATCIAYADEVTVSTKYLKRQLEGGASKDDKVVALNESITVVPNAIQDRLAKLRVAPKPEEKRNPLIMWRGSKTHQEDIFEFLREIVDVVNLASRWTFTFQGDKPWFLFKKLKDNAVFAGSIDIIDYFEFIHVSKPQAFMVPLKDSPFNRSKSNIAWLESVYAGGVAIAPCWEEWKVPGCLRYGNSLEFKNQLLSVIKGEVDVFDENARAWEFVGDTLLLSKVNQTRKDVLNRLLSKSRIG